MKSSHLAALLYELKMENNIGSDVAVQAKILGIHPKKFTATVNQCTDIPEEWIERICSAYNLTRDEFVERLNAVDIKQFGHTASSSEEEEAAPQEASFDSVPTVDIGRVMSTCNVQLEDIAGATDYPVAYIRNIMEHPEIKPMSDFVDRLKGSYPEAFGYAQEPEVEAAPAAGEKAMESYDIQGRTLLQRSLAYQMEHRINNMTTNGLSIVNSILDEIDDISPVYESNESYIANFIYRVSKEDRRQAVYAQGPEAMLSLAGMSKWMLEYAQANGTNLRPDAAARLGDVFFNGNRALIVSFNYLNTISGNKIDRLYDDEILIPEQAATRRLLLEKLSRISDEQAERILGAIWDDTIVYPPRGNRYLTNIRTQPGKNSVYTTPLASTMSWFARRKVEPAQKGVASGRKRGPKGKAKTPAKEPILTATLLSEYFGLHKSNVARVLSGSFDFQYSHFENLSKNFALPPDEKEMLRYVGNLSSCWVRYDMREKTVMQREFALQLSAYFDRLNNDDIGKILDIVNDAKYRCYEK